MSKPFEQLGNFTVFPNEILDDIMPLCKPNTWKVVCATVRKTLGWHKEVDKISLTQYHKITGIKSRETLVNALKDAVKLGFIIKYEGYTNSYSLNREYDTGSNGTEIVPSSSTETVHTKESSLKESKTPPTERTLTPLQQATKQLETHFVINRGCSPPNWDIDPRGLNKTWSTPLGNIWKKCGKDTDAAKSVIRMAIREMMRDGLTFSMPVQIYKKVDSLLADGMRTTDSRATQESYG